MNGEGIQPRAGLRAIGLDNFEPYLMNRIMGYYNAAMRAELTRMGLTTAKMRVLGVLSAIDGPTIGELGGYAVVEQSTLSRALDALDRDGLIRRATDRSDTRVTRVHLTDAGRSAFDRLWPKLKQSHQAMFHGVGSKERAIFRETLTKILANVRRDEI